MPGKPATDTAIIQCHREQKSRYEKLFESHKISHQSLHFASFYSQMIRFLQFLKIGAIDGRKILDLGCGLGDFHRFLNEQGIHTDYTGFDIVSGFIDHCQSTYQSAHFEKRNVLISKPQERFDYIFSSGIFAFGNREFFEQMIHMAFDLCRKAFAFNIYQTNDKAFFKICVEDVLFYCRRLKPKKITVLNKYLPDDYTVFLYK